MEAVVRPDELESWLRDTIRAQIASVNKAIEKAKADTEAQTSSLKEVVLDLSAKSDKDCAEKRNDRAMYKSARAVTRIYLELQDLLTANAPADPHSY